jgi:predicted nicotinamide N-methyase
MDSERLILAMASVDNVLVTFQREAQILLIASEHENYSIAEQDRFAKLVNGCWTDLGPSSRYIKALIRSYVAKVERAGVTMESNDLMDLVFRASTKTEERVPSSEESCYLSFRLPPDDRDRPWLRIQMYPYHNDVALRPWEAGAVLAEYFMQNSDLVRGKNVVELGAGVGLTGLTIAGCCGAKEVYMTDYTELCRVNLAHNISVNQDWLQASQENPRVTQGYLEWSSVATSCVETTDHKADVFDAMEVLIAADVIYDVDNLRDLVSVVRCFLQGAPEARQAIFGITQRNMTTFHTFIGLLRERGIVCDWKCVSDDDKSLPILFPCKFSQERADVRIAHMSMQ